MAKASLLIDYLPFYLPKSKGKSRSKRKSGEKSGGQNQPRYATKRPSLNTSPRGSSGKKKQKVKSKPIDIRREFTSDYEETDIDDAEAESNSCHNDFGETRKVSPMVLSDFSVKDKRSKSISKLTEYIEEDKMRNSNFTEFSSLDQPSQLFQTAMDQGVYLKSLKYYSPNSTSNSNTFGFLPYQDKNFKTISFTSKPMTEIFSHIPQRTTSLWPRVPSLSLDTALYLSDTYVPNNITALTKPSRRSMEPLWANDRSGINPKQYKTSRGLVDLDITDPCQKATPCILCRYFFHFSHNCPFLFCFSERRSERTLILCERDRTQNLQSASAI